MARRWSSVSPATPPASAGSITEIVERTDGVPLFVEEMTKAVLEAGVERGREIAASVPTAGLGGAGDVAGVADGTARPARPGGKGRRPDRRRDRPRILLRAGSCGRRAL